MGGKSEKIQGTFRRLAGGVTISNLETPEANRMARKKWPANLKTSRAADQIEQNRVSTMADIPEVLWKVQPYNRATSEREDILSRAVASVQDKRQVAANRWRHSVAGPAFCDNLAVPDAIFMLNNFDSGNPDTRVPGIIYLLV